ncbi:MAG: hypothetical protein LBC35_05995 [Coriobacteriales bacterium]|jgi:hypothetical protein|nr:hypothetical protein [Coriobacteriales bacterium]
MSAEKLSQNTDIERSPTNHIPMPNEGEELVVDWLKPLSYRVIPQRISEGPTQVNTAKRIVFAAERFAEFIAAVDTEFANLPNPLSFQVKIIPMKTGPNVQIDWSKTQFPIDIERVDKLGIQASEVLHHLRAATDYFYFNLVWLITQKRSEDRLVFPNFKAKPSWDKHVRKWKPNAEMLTIVDALEELQRFNGRSWIADLADLSNADKHYLPVFVSLSLEITIPSTTPVNQWVSVPAVPRLLVKLEGEEKDFIQIIHAVLAGIIDLTNPLLTEEGNDPIIYEFDSMSKAL